MAVSEFWHFLDSFTVDEATALLCDIEPGTPRTPTPGETNDHSALSRTLEAAIRNGELKVTYPLLESMLPGISPEQLTFLGRPITPPGHAMIARADLKTWATSKGMRAAFLQPAKNRGGRPPDWDWKGAAQEVERIATTKGLPKIQAKLVRHLMGWFVDAVGDSPDLSLIKKFVSRWYRKVGAPAS